MKKPDILMSYVVHVVTVAVFMHTDTHFKSSLTLYLTKGKKNLSISWVTTAYGGSWMGCTGPSGAPVYR